MRHLFLRSLLITPALILMAMAQGVVSPALGACGDPGPACGGNVPCSCGDTVVADAKLNGSDPVLQTPCPADGLFVASGVTLKINGTIRSQPSNVCSGIALLPGAHDVVVMSGRIAGFALGVEAVGVTNIDVSNLDISNIQPLPCPSPDCPPPPVPPPCPCVGISGNFNTIKDNKIKCHHAFSEDDPLTCEIANLMCRRGLIEINGSGNLVQSNRVDGGSGGIIVVGSDNSIERNLSQRNKNKGLIACGDHYIMDRNRSMYNAGEGYRIEGKDHTVTLNLAQQNGRDGFVVSATTSTFNRNRSNYNDGFGIFDGSFDDTNTYTANRCTGNDFGDSSPPGRCN